MSKIQILGCPFCEIVDSAVHDRILAANKFGFLIRDGYPVTPGHSLIILKRHIGSFFDISAEERQALFDLVDEAKVRLDAEFKPASYNVGLNDGPAAGQTVPHLHIHLIPRYTDTESDPRGGVRWVIPEKADYWSAS